MGVQKGAVIVLRFVPLIHFGISYLGIIVLCQVFISVFVSQIKREIKMVY